MGQVLVSIAGKSYRLACEDGDEPRLQALAQAFDETVTELHGSFGEVGDTRLAVMAGLVMTDRFTDAQTQIDQLSAQVTALKADLIATQSASAGSSDKVRQAVESVAERLERLTQPRQA
ncbi:MAG: cell division protein ZapA [Pseudomonadota bacterium]